MIIVLQAILPLPAFLSENVAKDLVESFRIDPIGEVDEYIEVLLKIKTR